MKPIDLSQVFFPLVERGFKVRRHAADFFVRWNDKFVCVFTLLSKESKVLICPTRWNPESEGAVEEIVKLILGFYGDIEVVMLD